MEISLVIANVANKGRGIITENNLPKNTIIETSPVIVMSASDRKLIDRTKLHNYIFEWGENLDKCALALGNISLYNHSYNSNCTYEMDYEEETMTIKTVRSIKAGEELTINYNGVPNSKEKIWFDAH